MVKGLHSTLKEPLNCILWNTFESDWELNATYQLQFTCYDDQSVGYSLIDSESSIFFDGQEYIVKQCLPDFSGGIEIKQVIAIHVYNEVQRVRQYKIKTGTLTYSVSDVLSFYLSGNAMGFTYAVVGSFAKAQLTDLGNESGKDMLSKIISTWPEAVIFPDNKKINVYSLAAFTKNYGARIDYLRDTTEIKLTYDSTNIVNQVKVFGKTKDSDNENSDVEEYYFPPHFVTNQESVNKWGLHQGEDVSDERFTDSAAIDKYALTQLTPEPSLTIDATYSETDKPIAGEQRRLEIRKTGYVTSVQVMAYVWYPFDKTQPTQLTLNNTAKTILDYQKNTNNQLNKAIADQKKLSNGILVAKQTASRAFNSRLTGLPVVNTKRMQRDATLPAFTLMVPDDNAEMGLAKGQTFYVTTRTDLVEGLETFVNGKIPEMPEIPEYKPATPTSDGLMSTTDKVKLDQLKIEPVPELLMTDKVDGSIYVITVEKGEIKLTKGGTKE